MLFKGVAAHTASTSAGCDDNSCRVAATVDPVAPRTPRPETGRRHEAGLLAPGSPLSSAFPRLNLSGVSDERSPATVAGAAANSHRVPFSSPSRSSGPGKPRTHKSSGSIARRTRAGCVHPSAARASIRSACTHPGTCIHPRRVYPSGYVHPFGCAIRMVMSHSLYFMTVSQRRADMLI